MNIEFEHIRGFRLRAHHLDRKSPLDQLAAAAGACGLQNSPPGAWETALFHRLERCTLRALHEALYESKQLLQAWSFRGAPVVFPTNESGVFLSALAARENEQPWIYTRGITAALDHMGMGFDDLLPLVRTAAHALEHETVRSKEALDRSLAERAAPLLPPEKRALWNAPSMYGSPDRQTVGGAVVSFLLRPCACEGRVVFGAREGVSPTFTSFRRWTGHAPAPYPDAERTLVRKFLHCYGPSTRTAFMHWLGCAPKQAARLWDGIKDEIVPISVQGRTQYLLSADLADLQNAGDGGGSLRLLGAHDPYLDVRDREVLLPDKAKQRLVWKTVANPGAVLHGGRIVGVWKAKTQKEGLTLTAELFEPLSRADQEALAADANAYAAFREMTLKKFACAQL